MKSMNQCCMWIRQINVNYFLRCKEKLKVVAEFFMKRVAAFSIMDFAVLKLCLLSFGLWLGSCFAKYLKKFRVFLLISFLISYVFLIWRIFESDKEQ